MSEETKRKAEIAAELVDLVIKEKNREEHAKAKSAKANKESFARERAIEVVRKWQDTPGGDTDLVIYITAALLSFNASVETSASGTEVPADSQEWPSDEETRKEANRVHDEHAEDSYLTDYKDGFMHCFRWLRERLSRPATTELLKSTTISNSVLDEIAEANPYRNEPGVHWERNCFNRGACWALSRLRGGGG